MNRTGKILLTGNLGPEGQKPYVLDHVKILSPVNGFEYLTWSTGRSQLIQMDF